MLRAAAGAVIVGLVAWMVAPAIDWSALRHRPAAVPNRDRTVEGTDNNDAARAAAVSISPAAATTAMDVLAAIEPSIALIEADGPNGLAPIGSAFVVDSSGLLATSYHVMMEATQAAARFRDGSVYEIEGYAALDRENDLAIVKLRGASGLTAAKLQTDDPAPLSPVIALGHPRGLEFSPYDGKVSRLVVTSQLPAATERFVRTLTASQRDHCWIQHTANLSDGNSGGPLIDSDGAVIGINTWTDRQTGFGYALGAAEISRLLEQPLGEIQPLERHATSDARLRAVSWQTSAEQLQRLHADAQAMRWQPASQHDYLQLQHLAWGITLANRPDVVGGKTILGDRFDELVKSADRVVAQLRREKWNDVGTIVLLNEFAAPEVARPAAGLMFVGTVERVVEDAGGKRAAIVRLAGFEQRLLVPSEGELSVPESGSQCLFVGVNDRGRTVQYGDNPLQPIVAPMLICPVVIELGR